MAHQAMYPITTMCRLLGVSTSGYHAWRRREPSRSELGEKRRRLLEQSWAGVFRDHLLDELPVDNLCCRIDERMGRPSEDLHVVIDWIHAELDNRGTLAVIPPKADRARYIPCDFEVYKWRHREFLLQSQDVPAYRQQIRKN